MSSTIYPNLILTKSPSVDLKAALYKQNKPHNQLLKDQASVAGKE
jgi:hypothetical protein